MAVVARGASMYGIQTWPESKASWQAQQEHLLVLDNRTMAYAEANLVMRVRLSGAARNKGNPH